MPFVIVRLLLSVHLLRTYACTSDPIATVTTSSTSRLRDFVAALRDEFVQEGGIERVLSLPRGDASVNALVAQIIANIADESA